MNITLLSSNDLRHEYLISLLSKLCDKLFVIQELRPTFENFIKNLKIDDKLFIEYFNFVALAQKKIFSDDISRKDNIKTYQIDYPKINNIDIKNMPNFFNSDIYIVFGSSFIKGELVDFLISKKAINIHAGLSPYYRGTDCNFWALLDNNPHLVGSTIHYLTKGLDDGPILCHALSTEKTNNYEYTMSTLKSAFVSVGSMIKKKNIFDLREIKQDLNKEIRFSKKKDFNHEILKKYFELNLDLNSKSFNKSLLINPFFL